MLNATHESVQAAMWTLAVIQGLIAACYAWLRRRSQGSHATPGGAAQRPQELLEQLDAATQAAGIHCWELDWNTGGFTSDSGQLPTHEAAREAVLQALARGERRCSFRYRVVLPDQTIRHIEAFVESECDRDGKLCRSLGASRDVTQEIEAADRAARDASLQRELLERLSVATQAAGLQCFEVDFKAGKMVWIDSSPEGDVSPEEAQKLGDAWLASVIPEDLEQVRELTKATRARHDPILSIRYRRRDPEGAVRYIQSYHHFFYDQDGSATRALGANIDITESHLRQVELEALSVRFEIATRAAHAGVWEWRERTNELWWNETMYVIHGLPANSPLPPREKVIDMIHPDDFPTAQAVWDGAMSGSGQINAQFRIIRPDGEIVHVESAAVLVTDTASSERRLVGITLDISKRVAAEQRERLLQKQLREASHQSGMAEVATGVLHNVGNVLNSLGVSSATARVRLRASHFDRLGRVAAMLEANRDTLGEFFASDPRGQRLSQYLSALGGRLRQDVEDLGQELDAIEGHFQYLRKIVQAQQSFARGGGAEEAVNIRELLETALELKGRELGGAQISRDIEELPAVWTNRYKLLQIIVHFIGDAGDVVAANEAGRREIAIRARLSGEWLEIGVEVPGDGMPADLFDRVWESGVTPQADSLGVGLLSAVKAAQQLGGSVATSSPGAGRGACFCVKIPARTGCRAAAVA